MGSNPIISRIIKNQYRTISSVGRARPWRGRGQRFESSIVHFFVAKFQLCTSTFGISCIFLYAKFLLIYSSSIHTLLSISVCIWNSSTWEFEYTTIKNNSWFDLVNKEFQGIRVQILSLKLQNMKKWLKIFWSIMLAIAIGGLVNFLLMWTSLWEDWTRRMVLNLVEILWVILAVVLITKISSNKKQSN